MKPVPTNTPSLGPGKQRFSPARFRKIFVDWHELARQVAWQLAETPAHVQSRRKRNKIEALFSELKLGMGPRRVRLRRLWNVAEPFCLAAPSQNLKRLVRFLAHRELSRAWGAT